MPIESVTSHNTHSLFAYERAKQTNTQQTQNTTLRSATTMGADTLEISEEAQRAADEKALLDEFSERAYQLLKTRKLSDEDMAAFKAIIDEAANSEDAKTFLKSLSAEERRLVQRANSYGMTLNNRHVDEMTQEGARNMLVQPDNRSYVDFNNDGVVDHGVGKSFVFPPPNAPDEVKDAWDKTVEGMSAKDRLLASAVFLSRSLDANLERDASGKTINLRTSGDAGYVNIFPTGVEGWFELLNDTDSYLDDAARTTMDPERLTHIGETRSLLNIFRENLME